MFCRSILAWSPTAIQLTMKKIKAPPASPAHALCNFLLLFFAQTKTCRCRSRVTVWLRGVTASRSPTLARMKAVRSPFFLVWILEGQNSPLSVASATIAAVEVMNLPLSPGLPHRSTTTSRQRGSSLFPAKLIQLQKKQITGRGSVRFLFTRETPTDKVSNFHSSVVFDCKMKNTLRHGFETYIVFYINNNEFEHPPHAHWNIFVQLLQKLQVSHFNVHTKRSYFSNVSFKVFSILALHVSDINHMPFKSCIFFKSCCIAVFVCDYCVLFFFFLNPLAQ